MLTRREFSKILGSTSTAALFSGRALSAPMSAMSQRAEANQKCDLLIKGGTVIDPGQRLHALLDVAVKDGKILEISSGIPGERATQVVSATGKVVTPGLVDVHVHCFDGVGAVAINADRYCLGRGVTTAVDAGSAGYPAIAGFRKYIINTSSTRIRALVDIGALGTLIGGNTGAMKNLNWLDPQLTARAAEMNKPEVVGIKVRLAEDFEDGAQDLECLKRAVEAAELSSLPLMVHILGPYSPLPDLLKMLRKGDIFTHCFNGRKHGVLDAAGKILPEVWDARHRGVLFDTAQGTFNLSFDVTEKCLEQGFLPEAISTDLSSRAINGPVFDMPTQISKFMALGLTIDKAIELATLSPGRMFNFGADVGTMRPGNEADVSIFELRDGQFSFFDSNNQRRTSHQMLVNTATVRRGQLFVNIVEPKA
jgi:dihydroorotase